MKRTLVILAVSMIAVTVIGCAPKTKVSTSIMPEFYEYIEFWNGGAMIRRYENARMEVEIATNYKAWGDDISFFKYIITVDGVTETIIDSEALSYVYRERGPR